MEYLLIFISAIFVNNIVLSQFLGICPFLGVSQKISTSLGMGAAVAFVLTLSTIVTYLVQIYILNPMGLQYLQTIAFILVIAALVQMVEIILKKVSPSLYQALGIYLPLITTNCAVLGVAILVIQKEYSLIQSVVYAFSTAVGFAVALIIFAGIREQLAMVSIPKGMRGMAIVLVTAGLLSLAFMGFSGVDGGLREPPPPPPPLCGNPKPPPGAVGLRANPHVGTLLFPSFFLLYISRLFPRYILQ